MKKFAIAAIVASLSAGAFAAQGDIIARLRVANVSPSASSDLAGLNVKGDTIPELDFTYMLTNNVGAELILGTSKHEVTLGGSKVASVKVLPPTLTLQYHMNPEGAFRPYVGAGVNFTRFYGFKDDTNLGLSVKSKSFGPALQMGADIPVTKSVFVNVDVKKIWMDTEVRSHGSKIASLSIDPVVTSVGIGMKF